MKVQGIHIVNDACPVLREYDGLLSEVWINTVQHSEELTCNIFRRPKGEEGIAIQFKDQMKITWTDF